MKIYNAIMFSLILIVNFSTCYANQNIAEATQAAIERTSRLMAHNETLEKLVKAHEAKINKLSTTISALETTKNNLTAEVVNWKSKYESTDVVDQVLVEAGEYSQNLRMVGIRIDPRNTSVQSVANNFCANKGSPRIKHVYVRSGGCCGYNWWIVSCLRGK